MSEGNLTQRLTLRKGDQFSEAAEVINELLANYQSRLARAQALLASDQELTADQRRELAEHLGWFVTRHED
jgi:hypothetical protein